MRDARYEMVRRDPTEAELADPEHRPQPWHARLRSANVELTWGTETYVNRDGARGAIGQNASVHSPVHKASVYPDHVDVWLDDEELGEKHSVPIVEIDERLSGRTDYHAGRAVGGSVEGPWMSAADDAPPAEG